jgi:hypothetical protein
MLLKEQTPFAFAPRSLPRVVFTIGPAEVASFGATERPTNGPRTPLATAAPQLSKDDFINLRRLII